MIMITTMAMIVVMPNSSQIRLSKHVVEWKVLLEWAIITIWQQYYSSINNSFHIWSSQYTVRLIDVKLHPIDLINQMVMMIMIIMMMKMMRGERGEDEESYTTEHIWSIYIVDSTSFINFIFFFFFSKITHFDLALSFTNLFAYIDENKFSKKKKGIEKSFVSWQHSYHKWIN